MAFKKSLNKFDPLKTWLPGGCVASRPYEPIQETLNIFSNETNGQDCKPIWQNWSLKEIAKSKMTCHKT